MSVIDMSDNTNSKIKVRHTKKGHNKRNLSVTNMKRIQKMSPRASKTNIGSKKNRSLIRTDLSRSKSSSGPKDDNYNDNRLKGYEPFNLKAKAYSDAAILNEGPPSKVSSTNINV